MVRPEERLMNIYKKGDIVNYKGNKAVVTSLNPNGTVTLHHAAGNGKTGYIGTIPAVKSEYSRTAFTKLVKDDAIEGDEDVFTLDSYNLFIDVSEEATLNGYARGRSDMAQQMRLKTKRQLKETPSIHLQWIHDRLAEIEDAEYVTEDGEVSEYKTVKMTEGTMKPYNAGHGVGMRDLRSQMDLMLSDYQEKNPDATKQIEWFNSATAAEKKAEPVKKRTSDDEKTPQDFLRLARYMYKETIANPGEYKRHAGYKRYLGKVMHHYGVSEAEAYELVTGNLSNEKGKDPQPVK
jgi:hypothetical protein